MHYVFDKWMKIHHKTMPWIRYADDAIIHCKTESQAQYILLKLEERMKICKLQLHPDKTSIIYCKDSNRKAVYPNQFFDFLGYTFRPRRVKKSGTSQFFVSFSPSVSNDAIKSMRATIKMMKLHKKTSLSLEDIAKLCNPILCGWLNYYGKYNKAGLAPVLRHFNKTIIKWAMNKFKKLKGRKTNAARFLTRIYEENPTLFAHWKIGMRGDFA